MHCNNGHQIQNSISSEKRTRKWNQKRRVYRELFLFIPFFKSIFILILFLTFSIVLGLQQNSEDGEISHIFPASTHEQPPCYQHILPEWGICYEG